MSKQKKPAENIPLDELFVSFEGKVTALSSGKAKTFLYTGLVLSVILSASSSLLFSFNLLGSWVPALIGAPAGVILFLLGLGLIYRTKIKEWAFFQIRESLSFRQRVRRVLICFVLYVLVSFPLSGFIPYGIGGSLLICLTLGSLAFGRRTPEELKLAEAGLPDPRDISEDEERDDYATPAEVSLAAEKNTEADILYDKRGGVGGKLG